MSIYILDFCGSRILFCLFHEEFRLGNWNIYTSYNLLNTFIDLINGNTANTAMINKSGANTNVAILLMKWILKQYFQVLIFLIIL